jgi:hypothetical protein
MKIRSIIAMTFIIAASTGAAQSVFTTNSVNNPLDIRVICPICEKEGRKSTVMQSASTTTLVATVQTFDEAGNARPYRDPNTTTTTYTCSNGHSFSRSLGGAPSFRPSESNELAVLRPSGEFVVTKLGVESVVAALALADAAYERAIGFQAIAISQMKGDDADKAQSAMDSIKKAQELNTKTLTIWLRIRQAMARSESQTKAP